MTLSLVQRGRVRLRFDGLGETYGQWGRYLLRNRVTAQWHWQPTPDGSLPSYDPQQETRFTDWCGGPALVRRYYACLAERKLPKPKMVPLAFDPSACRSVAPEKALLAQITQAAYGNATPFDETEQATAQEFITEVGNDIGGALICLYQAFRKDVFRERVVLMGGIGENFGVSPQGANRTDLLRAAIATACAEVTETIVRSSIGVDAEIVGLLADTPPTARNG